MPINAQKARFLRDPQWITVKMQASCSGCRMLIARGAKAFYFPCSRELFGADCGCGLTRAEDQARPRVLRRDGNRATVLLKGKRASFIDTLQDDGRVIRSEDAYSFAYRGHDKDFWVDVTREWNGFTDLQDRKEEAA